MQVDEHLAKRLHEELDTVIKEAFDFIEFDLPTEEIEDASLARSIVSKYFGDTVSSDLFLGDIFAEFFSEWAYTLGEEIEDAFTEKAQPIVKDFVDSLSFEFEEVVETKKFMKLKVKKDA